jgi:serine/threonine protein kinase
MSSDPQRAQSVFLAAVERPSLGRATFLDSECNGDDELRQRVEALLKAHDEPGSFLDAPPPGIEVATMPPIDERPGTVIGPYKLLEQIGEGGFGVVFLAEQERPVRRRVALKIIKPGMDTRQVIARFEAERQALAMMDHPNIAKVLDAGMVGAASRSAPDLTPVDTHEGPARLAGPTGRPYFVMELVQGVPITEYCDQCNLTTRERLELFVTVCQAVQHAHQKGVIHRDIKPTNVLVAIQDGQPTPKIIDFGVAKAINQQLTEHTLVTAFAQIVGTPLYMSPEQAELSPLGVDTRSDIYSLGVLLYELLTGTTPFDKDRLHSASYDELRRIIREEEPPRPSARISTLAADLATTVAEHRRTDARRLRQTVRGELDWIVMKCLEKERNRRYETPNSLARDIERYMHDEPVQACPPSTAYRVRKYARRNKTLLAAGGAIAAALVVGLGLSTWQYFRATTEGARAKAVSEFLQEMLASSNPDQTKGSQYSVRNQLDDFSAGLGNQLAGQPEVEADIRSIIGKSYWRLGVYDRAELHSNKALDLRRELYGPGDERVADSLVDYAWSLAEQGRHAEAEKHVQDALAIYRKQNSDPRLTVRALWSLQQFLMRQSRYADAEEVANDALALAGDDQDSDFAELPNILHGLAEAKSTEGKYSEAEKFARRAVDIHRRVHGNRHPETAHGLWVLGSALLGQQNFAEAKAPLREALAIFREYYGPEHRAIRGVSQELKSVLEASRDETAIEVLARDEAAHASRSGSPAHHVRLAELLLTEAPSKDARKAEGRRLIRRAMDDYGRMAADAPRDQERRLEAVDGYLEVARLCLTDPDFAQEVDEVYRRRTEELERLLAAFPDSVSLQNEAAYKHRHWAFLVEGVSRCWPQYENSLRQSIDLFEKVALKAPKSPRLWFHLASSCGYFGDAAWVSAKSEDAETAFKRAMEIYDQHRAEIENESNPKSIRDIVRRYTCVAYYLTATHRPQQAADYVGRASASAKRLTDPTLLAESLYYVALMQARLGDTAGYRATCKTMVGLPFSEIVPPRDKGRFIVTLCILPGALEDPRVPVKLVEAHLAKNPRIEPHAGPNLLGTALSRAGHFEQAAKQLEDALELYPSRPPLAAYSINSLRLRLAMTKWQLGQRDAARELLSKTLPAIEEEMQIPTCLWNRRALLELWRGEAQALIGPKEADEAVENERTNDE